MNVEPQTGNRKPRLEVRHKLGSLMCHNRKMGTFGLILVVVVIVFLCTNYSLFPSFSYGNESIYINYVAGCKTCGGKVINFTIQRLFKESRVKHSETGD